MLKTGLTLKSQPSPLSTKHHYFFGQSNAKYTPKAQLRVSPQSQSLDSTFPVLLYISSSLILFQPSYTFPALLYFSSPLIPFQPSCTFPALLYFSSPLILFQSSYTFPVLLYFSSSLILFQPSYIFLQFLELRF